LYLKFSLVQKDSYLTRKTGSVAAAPYSFPPFSGFRLLRPFERIFMRQDEGEKIMHQREIGAP